MTLCNLLVSCQKMYCMYVLYVCTVLCMYVLYVCTVYVCYIHHERIKKRNYEQRINEIEHGSFTPLIFSTSGGMGKAASIFYKRLGGMLAEKRHQPYSNCMRWLRCHLNFSLLRSSIMCLRGSRSGRFPCTPDSLRLATSECRI